MTLQEQRDIIQAAIDGKTIELRQDRTEEAWRGCQPISFNFAHYRYRVKPEPREWMVTECTDGNIWSGYPTCAAKKIKVREVL